MKPRRISPYPALPSKVCALFLLLACGIALAAPVPATPGLLPTAMVRSLLEQDPAVAAARASYEAARDDATLLEDSPYEWTAKVTAQRRTVEDNTRYREWNAGLERTLRLPGKAKADRKLAGAVLEEGAARYGEAVHDAARSLLALWLAWANAAQAADLAVLHVNAAQENLAIVEKRVRAGDAARLDASVARAELHEQQRAASDAKTAVAVAWAQLHGRYPGVTQQFSALPAAVPLDADMLFWRQRIAQQSDALKIAAADVLKAQALGDRAQAEKTPDPTIGFFTASEVGGRERLAGVMLSIPLPGSQRGTRASQSVHLAEAARQQGEVARRSVDAEVAAAVAQAQGSHEGWQLAAAAATAMDENSHSMQRAYQLGEADLQSLLTARRQAATAAQAALAAQLAAVQAYYTLLVDAHLVWDLAHE